MTFKRQLALLEQNVQNRLGVVNIALNDYVSAANNVIVELKKENTRLEEKLKEQVKTKEK